MTFQPYNFDPEIQRYKSPLVTKKLTGEDNTVRGQLYLALHDAKFLIGTSANFELNLDYTLLPQTKRRARRRNKSLTLKRTKVKIPRCGQKIKKK